MKTHNILFSIFKKENHPYLSLICSQVFLFSKGLENEFKIAVVNESSVFEPLISELYATSAERRQLLLTITIVLFLL